MRMSHLNWQVDQGYSLAQLFWLEWEWRVREEHSDPAAKPSKLLFAPVQQKEAQLCQNYIQS